MRLLDVRSRTRVSDHRRPLALFIGCFLGGCSSLVDSQSSEATSDANPGSSSTTSAQPGTGQLPGTTQTSGVELTSTTSTGAASSSTDEPTGNTFLIDPDGGVDIECSVFEQACPPGEKCNIWANDGGSMWNATRCVPVDRAPDIPGAPCTVESSPVSGLDSCALGSICWDVDSRTLEGTCVSFCTGSENAPVCEDGLTCAAGNLVFLCLSTCDPLLQNCVDGEGCYLLDDTLECAPDDSQDAGAAFETCTFPNACDPGLACTDAAVVGLCDEGAETCCTPFCDLKDPTCLEGTQCISAFPEGMVPPGYEDVGVCGQDPR
ncbi:MAG: hypothetical protein ACRBN8_16415 [Nannocystales bacterium]